MEGNLNLSSRNSMQRNGSYNGYDMQGSIRYSSNPHHHLGSILQPTIHENFPLTIGNNNQEREQTLSLSEYNRLDRTKSTSDDEEPSFMEDANDPRSSDPTKGGGGGGGGKKASPWQRVKWTDGMVRLLITAVSYISEEAASEYGVARRKCANLQKKGKWKSVSKVMAERGHFVSPQQCEDKFNDLNKRYKRLNEILGRGTSCEVVENPVLLDSMDHVSEKSKEEVRKILSSKHLHYEEMCSYHNGNRLHLPPDPELQRSLRLALRNRDDQDENDAKRHHHLNDENDEDDQELESDESEENQNMPMNAKRSKQCHAHEGLGFKNPSNVQAEGSKPDANVQMIAGENSQSESMQKPWIHRRSVELEEQRLQIEEQMLELERERFKWQRFCRKKDRELETMKMEIERMRLENERMALTIRQKELGLN